MIDLPRTLSDPLLLADWLELSALAAQDGDASAGDLQSALQIMPDPEADDDLLEQVMLELEYRERATGLAYPFRVEEASVLQTQGDWRSYTPYVFCLCLSYVGQTNPSRVSQEVRRLFEGLCALAAEGYLQGRSMQFGRACERGQDAFPEAVRRLCMEIGEGGGFQRRTQVQA